MQTFLPSILSPLRWLRTLPMRLVLTVVGVPLAALFFLVAVPVVLVILPFALLLGPVELTFRR